jgi:hypothetical protein
MVKDLRPPAGGEKKSKIAEIWKRDMEVICERSLRCCARFAIIRKKLGI